MSRYPLQDGLTGQRAPNIRSTIPPASLSDRSCHCPGASGMLERNHNRVKQDGVGTLERTAKREGWGAVWGSSWRIFGAPWPVLNPGLTQRDMEREDRHAPPPPTRSDVQGGPASILYSAPA